MSAPFIVKSVSKIHPGKADSYQREGIPFSLYPLHWGGFTRLQADQPE